MTCKKACSLRQKGLFAKSQAAAAVPFLWKSKKGSNFCSRHEGSEMSHVWREQYDSITESMVSVTKYKLSNSTAGEITKETF